MSRTRRSGIEWLRVAGGEFYTWDQYDTLVEEYRKKHNNKHECFIRYPMWSWSLEGKHTKDCRDGKHHNGVMGSAPAWYKKLRRRRERRIVRECMHHGKEIPHKRKSDSWYW